MFKTSAAFSVGAILAFALTGCGGGGGGRSSVVPPTSGGSNTATAPPTKSTVKFTIVVPKSTASGAHRPAYVSPATQSMTVNITGNSPTANPTGFPMTVGLTPTSTGCASSLASTTCTLQLSLNPGSYTATISTYDGTNGTGNALSTAQGVTFTVAANTNNTVPLTLSGIPAQIALSYPGSGKFSVVALDNDGNYIIGAGAPTFTVAKTGGVSAVTITQPTASSPNAFSIAVTSAVGSETLTVTAGYPAGLTSGCTQAGAVCTASFTAADNQTMFAMNDVTSTGGVLGFTLPFTSSSQVPLYSFSQYYPEANGVALDSNGNLFVGSYYDENDPVIEVKAPYTGGATTLFSAYANSLALDSNNNLFVSSYEESTVTEFKAPYTGSAINTFSVSDPWIMALDANNDLFVATFAAYVVEYPYSSSNGTYGAAVDIPTDGNVSSVWFDASGDLWAGMSSTIQEFKPSFSASSTAAVTITGAYPGEYCTGAFDASGNLYVGYDESTGYIDEYKASTIAAGGTVSSPDVQVAGGEYACVVGVDAANNLYTLTDDGFGMSDGGAAEFTLPLSSASTPAFTVSSGFYEPYYGGGVLTKPGQLTVTL